MLLLRLLLPSDADDDPFERGLLSAAVGFGAVSVLAWTLAVCTFLRVTPFHVAGAAVLLVLITRRRLRKRELDRTLPRPSALRAAARRGGRALVLPSLLCAGVFSLFLLNYDRAHFQYGCIHTVVQIALSSEVNLASSFADAGSPHSRAEEGRRRTDPGSVHEERDEPPPWMMPLLFVGSTGQRYGTTAVIAPSGAVFGFLGFRLVYAFHAALLAGFLFLGIRGLTGAPRLAALSAALATANPWLLKISLLDENLLAATWAAGALVVAMRRVPSPALAGLFAGLAIGIRHIDLSLLPALAVLLVLPAAAGPLRVRLAPLKSFAVAAFLVLLHELVHHQVAYGSLLSHEHFVDEVWWTTRYELLGRAFDYAGLLQWPFADGVIRTPYNGFPTFLLLPLSAVAHLGTLFFAIAAAGVLLLARERRRLFVALLLWGLPLLALFALLEDWLDPNKMGIPVTLLPALGLAFGLGLHAAVERWNPRLAWPALIGLALLSGLGIRALRSVEIPDDPLFYEKYPLVRSERPEYAEEDRRRLTRGNLVPDFRQVTQHSPLSPGLRLRGLARELSDRSFRQGPLAERAAELSGELAVELDLSEPLVGRPVRLEPSPGEALDLREEGTAILLEQGSLPWADRPADLLAVHDPGGRIRLFLRFGLEDFGDFDSVDGFTIDARKRPDMQRRAFPKGPVRLRLPIGASVEVVETVSLDQVLIYRWDGRVRPDGVQLSAARKLFHN